MEEHRKNCERQGKYVEAEIAKNRLDELKLHEELFTQLAYHLPAELTATKAAIEKRLAA